MRRYAIVGCGIIGSYSALYLSQRQPDATITIVDRNPYAYDNASCGNMGGFASCEVRPLATVSNILRGLGWMLDPLAPFTLRPKSIPGLAPWISRFVRSAITPGHTQHVIDAQQALMSKAYEAHQQMLAGTGLDDLISEDGTLVVYKNEKRRRKDWDSRWRLFREQGKSCALLTEDELHDRLPALRRSIRHGIHVPAIRYWRSPARLLRGLHELLHARGVVVVSGDVQNVELDSDGTARRLILQGGEALEFEHLTVAAGAWSKALCADIGDFVPLDSERGYSTTLRQNRLNIRNLLLFPDDEFVATPMEDGLRLGGTVELADFECPPNFGRTDILATTIKDYFPEADTSDRDEWMGNRPSLPDGLPVIGRSPTCSNVCYAFGHGHVGMTQSAITGRLVGQLIGRQTPELDITPYSIARFA